MRKNSSVSIVEKTVEQFGDDKKRLAGELKRLVKDGQEAGDLLMIGAAYHSLAELYNSQDDEKGVFSYALKAVTCLKDTNAYELLAKAYLFLGRVYNYQDNPQASMEMNETAYRLISRHRTQGEIRINALNSLASDYKALGDIQKAIRLMTKCLSLAETSPEADLTGRAMFMLNLAEYHRENLEPEKTREILLSMKPWIGKVGFQALVCVLPALRDYLISAGRYTAGRRFCGHRACTCT